MGRDRVQGILSADHSCGGMSSGPVIGARVRIRHGQLAPEIDDRFEGNRKLADNRSNGACWRKPGLGRTFPGQEPLGGLSKVRAPMTGGIKSFDCGTRAAIEPAA